MGDHYNPFQEDDIAGDLPEESGQKTKTNINSLPLIIIGGILIIIAIVVYVLIAMKGSNNKDTTMQSRNPVVSKLKSESVLFLNHFFNLNYTMFKEERRRAEKYMTSSLLTQYKEIFYDNMFTDEIVLSKLATDYIYNDILAGVIEGKPVIKVIGVIKYTSTKKNVSVEMPITMILYWQKNTDGLWKIDKIEMDM